MENEETMMVTSYAKTYLFNPDILQADKIQNEFGQWLEKDTVEFLRFKIRILAEAVRIEKKKKRSF